MKSFLKVLVSTLSFGIPLFIRALSRSRKLTQIINDNVDVILNFDNDNKKVIIKLRNGTILATLVVDKYDGQDI